MADRPGLRPTPDRVRETLFNWLGQDLSGWRCLDAFAGSGALGFEAASRGAAEVVLLERDRRAGRAACARRRSACTRRRVRIERADALAWMARCGAGAFDLVFLDPPFDRRCSSPRSSPRRASWRAGGFVYVEAPAAARRRAGAERLEPWRAGRAGAVHFHLLDATRERRADCARRADSRGGYTARDLAAWRAP